MSKNVRQRRQTDAECWHGLFDTQAGPEVSVSSLSKPRPRDRMRSTRLIMTTCPQELVMMADEGRTLYELL